MALLHFDGFDNYANTTQLGVRYPGLSGGMNIATSGGRFGGGYWSGTGTVATLPKAVSPGSTTLIVGCAWNYNSVLSNSHYIVQFYNAAGIQVGLWFNATTQRIEAYRSSTLLGIVSGQITPSTWHHLEFKVTVADGGSVEVRVDGVAGTVLSGVDTQHQATTGVTTVTLGTVVWSYLDDWYVLDNTGPAPLNDFLGDCRITTVRPTADSSVAWTRSTGSTNAAAIDDTAVDATDYVGSSTVGQRDVYDLGDLTGSPAIYAMQATAWALKNDAGTRGIKVGLRYGGAETQTADAPLATTTNPYILTNQTAAPGSVAWTAAVVNATQLTLEVGS